MNFSHKTMKATKKSWSLTKGVTLNVAATCTLVTFEYNATQLNKKILVVATTQRGKKLTTCKKTINTRNGKRFYVVT